MTFQLNASHLQHERESEAEHERLVRQARAEPHHPSPVGRAREAVGLRIVGLGLALAGEAARRRTRDGSEHRSVAV